MKWLGILILGALGFGAQSQDDIVARFEKAQLGRATCRANLMTLANASMGHRVITHQAAFTSNLDDLKYLIAGPLTCPAGGTYSIDADVPKSSFTVHCTVLSHDSGFMHPSGQSPDVSSGFEEPVEFERLRRANERAATCRANLMTLSNLEVALKLKTGYYPPNFEGGKEFLAVLPICPEGGTYSVQIDDPKGSFTVHCSVRRHDQGLIEPKGYSPGLNSQ